MGLGLGLGRNGVGCSKPNAESVACAGGNGGDGDRARDICISTWRSTEGRALARSRRRQIEVRNTALGGNSQTAFCPLHRLRNRAKVRTSQVRGLTIYVQRETVSLGGSTRGAREREKRER